MAEVDAIPTFGSELKDGFKQANAWAAHGVAWLDDIQQFYRERSAIEKEYSAKLSALAKKYFDKKNKKTSLLSVGDTPTMTPGSLESASVTTWTTQLTTLESRAAEIDQFANHLISQVAEPLKYYGTRFEDLRKRHAEYADKLASERDGAYADLRKVKGKYDGVCQEVEARRKKSESHYDKAKAQNAYQQQLFEMHNAKNSYLIAINVTNKQKHKYYEDYVPEVMDSLQDLTEFRTLKLNGLWTTASRIEGEMLSQSRGMMDTLGTEIARNEPHLDSMMYMRHNMGAFQEPADKGFEPSPVWHDDAAMVTDETAQIYLRNLLSKSKSQLGELRREVDKKQREVNGVKQTKERVRAGTEKKDEVEVVRVLFVLQQDLHALDKRLLTADIETSTITMAVGDVTRGAKNHNFKGQTFKIPTNCDLCGERIWGLSAKGFDCRDCGYTCHSKCEMKVPPDCPGEQTKDERKKLKAARQEAANSMLKPSGGSSTHVGTESPALSRSDTMNSLSSHSARRSVSGSVNGPLSPAAAADEATPSTIPEEGRPSMSSVGAASRRHRVMAPPPSAYVSEGGPAATKSSTNGGGVHEKRGKMMYGFDAGGEGELSVQDGREVTLLEPDDGSGWVKVRAGYKEGIVPSSYVDFTTPLPSAPIPARPSSSHSSSTASSSAAPANHNNNSSSNHPPPPLTATPTGGTTASSSAGKKKGPAVAPKRGARKLKYVEALYEYSAQDGTEHSMVEGERFVLVKDDPGDGWVEVEKAGVTGSVPASYVQVV